MSNDSQSQPRTAFDWAIYADATLAALAMLIPIPVLDWIVEWFFSRRILRAISKRQARQLDPGVIRLLNKNNDRGCKGYLVGCLTLPLKLTIELIKSLSRKILYFLTIKDATNQLSHYWHQAFLLDHMLLAGHLDDVESAKVARLAMEKVLSTSTNSPLLKLAQQVTSSIGSVFGVLSQARRHKPDHALEQPFDTRSVRAPQALQIGGRWSDFEAYLRRLAAQYEQVYQALQEEANLVADHQ